MNINKFVRYTYKIVLLLLFITTSFLLNGCDKKTKLDTPNVIINDNKISWELVKEATSYDVYINNILEQNTTDNYLTINYIVEGQYKIQVVALTEDESITNSNKSNEVIYTITRLQTPVIVLNDQIVSWTNIENADYYQLYVNNVLYENTTKTTFDLSTLPAGDFQVKLVARSSLFKYLNSFDSNSITYNKVNELLTINEAKQAIDKANPLSVKVSFIGKVIGFDSLGYAHVADETGAIYVRAINENLKLNEVVKITGNGFIYTGGKSTTYPEYTRQIKEEEIEITKYDGEINTLDPIQVDAQILVSDWSTNYQTASFHGNLVSITGIIEEGTTKFKFYLNDDYGHHLIGIHHYSSNFQNDITDNNKNAFLGLNGKRVTLTGIIYRYYVSESIWTFQSIGYDNELKVIDNKLPTLDSPIVSLNDHIINWTKIENAIGYQIYNNNYLCATTTDLYFDLTTLSSSNCLITVRALGDGINYSSSEDSNKITYVTSTKEVNFLMINDTHGVYDDPSKGMSKLATLIKTVSNEDDDYINIANGDIFQGSYVSSLLYGKPMIDALNEMKFDCFVIGNHEFDWGLDKIAVYKDNDLTNGEADFPFLGANIVYEGTNNRVEWLEPYTVVEVGNYKIGIIGVIGYGLESSILTENVAPYDFLNPVPIVEKYARELRTTNNCDIVVVATHDYSYNTNNDYASFNGDARIDAIFCGHTHEYLIETIDRQNNVDVPVMQTNGYNSSVIGLSFILNQKQIDSYKVKTYYPNQYQNDYDMDQVIKNYESTINEGKRVLGTTASYLSRSQLGMMAIKAMKDKYNVDIAIMNTGGVRSTISQGVITVADVFEVFPFNNMIILTEISKSYMEDFYYNNASYLYANENINTILNNEQTIYSLAIIDYVYTSTRYNQFKNCIPEYTNVLLRDVLIEYIDNLYN